MMVYKISQRFYRKGYYIILFNCTLGQETHIVFCSAVLAKIDDVVPRLLLIHGLIVFGNYADHIRSVNVLYGYMNVAFQYVKYANIICSFSLLA